MKLDVKDIEKGYRANALKLRPVVNDKDETIAHIDDFIQGRQPSVRVVAVGDFIGLDGHLIAVPFRSLKFNDPAGSILLPGAMR